MKLKLSPAQTVQAAALLKAKQRVLVPVPRVEPKPVKATPKPPASAAKASAEAAKRRVERRQATLALVRVLRERWPEAFSKPQVPLAIGVHAELRQALGPEVPAARLGAALHYWTNGLGYLQALTHGVERRHLDGSPAGEVSAEHRQIARERYEAAVQRVATKAKTDAAAGNVT